MIKASLKTWFALSAAVALGGCSVSQNVSPQPGGGDPHAGQAGGASARSFTSGMSGAKVPAPPTAFSAEGAGLTGQGAGSAVPPSYPLE